MVTDMKRTLLSIAGLVAVTGLSGCYGLTPYSGGDNVIASAYDQGHDQGTLVDGGAAIVYDGDGCQVWLIDDGVEGYSGRRFDPKTGLPICDNAYPPGTVLRWYQSPSPGIGDWVPVHG